MSVTASIRLTCPLGAGGMGSVWVAHHSGIDADVAVKFLSPALAAQDALQLRFAEEAVAAAQIKSPYVVNVYDHGVLEGELPFIVMELLEGRDLARYAAEVGPLDWESATLLVEQLGHVLAKAHEAGIVHRDVKPGNVFLVEGYGDLFVKLIDFGIAKRLRSNRSLTDPGTMVGTPDYMCPEQMHSARDVGPAADLWGLAAVAYYSIVGVAPFARETIPGTVLALEQGDLHLPFREFAIGSPALDDFFARALCRDPEGRYDALSELVAAFTTALRPLILRPLELTQSVAEERLLDLASGAEHRSEGHRSEGHRAVTRLDLPRSAPRRRFGATLLQSFDVARHGVEDTEVSRAPGFTTGVHRVETPQVAEGEAGSPATYRQRPRTRGWFWACAVFALGLLGGRWLLGQNVTWATALQRAIATLEQANSSPTGTVVRSASASDVPPVSAVEPALATTQTPVPPAPEVPAPPAPAETPVLPEPPGLPEPLETPETPEPLETPETPASPQTPETPAQPALPETPTWPETIETLDTVQVVEPRAPPAQRAPRRGTREPSRPSFKDRGF